MDDQELDRILHEKVYDVVKAFKQQAGNGLETVMREVFNKVMRKLTSNE